MANKQETIEQVRLAFELVQRLYLEVSYLVKEIEGQLLQEPERFVICRPAGYAVTNNRSSGLEANLVNYWVMRQFSVAFVPEQRTQYARGQTETQFGEELKFIYLRVILDSADKAEPCVMAGILEKVQRGSSNFAKKWEHVMSHLEIVRVEALAVAGPLSYADQYVSFQGHLLKVNLFDLTSADELRSKVIEPVLELYRKSNLPQS